MRVLVFEPQFLGHNLAHAARLVRATLDLGLETVLATSRQAVASEEFQLHLGGLTPRITVLELQGFKTDGLGRRVLTAGFAGAWASYRGLARAVRSARPDHVYVPYGNVVARVACVPGPLRAALAANRAEAETLIVGGSYFYEQASPLRQLRRRAVLQMVASGPWRTVFHLDDLAVEGARRFGGRLAQVTRLMPEPAAPPLPVSQPAARRALGAPLDGRLLVVTGLIEPRKGLGALLAGLREANDRLRATDRMLLIGSFHPDAHRLLQEEGADLVASGRVVAIDRRLTDEEIRLVPRAADVVATVYPHHRYTSGILASAAAAGTPVLGSDAGWIGRTIRRFDLGRTCNAWDPRDVAHQVVGLLESSATHRPGPRATRFAEFMTEANFAAAWTSRLRERMGAPQSAARRDWEWALGEGPEALAGRLAA